MEEIKVKKTGIIKLQSIKDGFDGVLSIAECGRQIPFDVKRTYYIYNLINHRDVIRGKHAHKSFFVSTVHLSYLLMMVLTSKK